MTTLQERVTALAQAVAADVKALQNGKAAATHTHAIADVAGLLAALDGKQAALGFTITVSTTAPPSPATGDVWISY